MTGTVTRFEQFVRLITPDAGGEALAIDSIEADEQRKLALGVRVEYDLTPPPHRAMRVKVLS